MQNDAARVSVERVDAFEFVRLPCSRALVTVVCRPVGHWCLDHTSRATRWEKTKRTNARRAQAKPVSGVRSRV